MATVGSVVQAVQHVSTLPANKQAVYLIRTVNQAIEAVDKPETGLKHWLEATAQEYKDAIEILRLLSDIKQTFDQEGLC